MNQYLIFMSVITVSGIDTSFLMGADDAQLSQNDISNCKFISSTELNILYCNYGKLIIQDARNTEIEQQYILPEEVFEYIVQYGINALKIIKNRLDHRKFYIKVGLEIYSIGLEVDELIFRVVANLDGLFDDYTYLDPSFIIDF